MLWMNHLQHAGADEYYLLTLQFDCVRVTELTTMKADVCRVSTSMLSMEGHNCKLWHL